MDTRYPLPHQGRQARSGKALGNIFLGLTALALLGFLIQATPGCSGGDPEAPSGSEGATEGAEVVETAEQTPELPQIDDPDEPLGVFNFELPVLAFREHSEALPTTGSWLGYPMLADLDGDGDCDLVASNREEDGVSIWRFDPERPWELCNEGLPRDMSYGPTAVADIDGDGDNDALIGDHTEALRVFLNDGDMGWTESDKQWKRPYILKDMAVTDFNGDGRPDVATVNHFKGGINVYVGTPNGGLHMAYEDLLHERVFGQKLVLIDIDLDGVDDIAANTNEGLLVFLTRRLENGDLAWEDVSTGLPAPSIGNSLFGLAAGYFNEEERSPQLAVCSVPDPGLPPEEMNGVGVYALRDNGPDGWAWVQIDEGLPRADRYKEVVAADFNADGHLDLLTANLEKGRVIFLGDGTGSFDAAGRIVGHGKCRMIVADIDGNGYPDVLSSTSGQKGKKITGKLRVFMNEESLW